MLISWSISARMIRIITAQPMTPSFVLDVTEQHKVNMLFASASSIAPFTECMLAKRYDLSHLMMLQTGGSLLSAATRAAFAAQHKGVIVNGYGLTDVGGGVAISTNTFSSGKLLPGIRIRIVDVDTGEGLGPNETGELWLKTPVPLLGYLKSTPIVRDDTADDGWYRTGDLGYFDGEDGELYLVDRQKDMIKYKGYQVVPSEVEHVIEKYCVLNGVVVVGVPDNDADGQYLPAAVCVRSEKHLTVTEEEIGKIVEGKVQLFF